MNLSLTVRRIIAASPAVVFSAWTDPEQLLIWWGPRDVSCTMAEVDGRTGGDFRLDNLLPDGTVVVITGTFLRWDPPRSLEYSWRVAPGSPSEDERVLVNFIPHPDGTEVVVQHSRIPSEAARRSHERGWTGCMEGLTSLVGSR